MAIWDNWRERVQSRRELLHRLHRTKTANENGINSIFSISACYRGLDIIPVVLALDAAGNVTVRCNSLKTGILRFVAEHEAELAQALADLPGRKWDSMTDSVEELITRVQRMQNAG